MWRTPFAAAAALLFAAHLSAHHSFVAQYDENKPLKINGSVIRFDWINPHAWLYVEATDESGKAVAWSFEMGSPGALRRRGWGRTALKEGDRITVEGFASKDGRKLANAATVTMPDGRKLFGGFHTTPGAPAR